MKTIKSIVITYTDGTVDNLPVPDPVVVPPPPPPAPLQVIPQDSKTWFSSVPQNDRTATRTYVVQNTVVNDGGILLAQGIGNYVLKNVGNVAGSPNGGMYAVMLWPNALADGTQQAVASLDWDNSEHPELIVHQGKAEAAFRGKCDNCTVKNVHFMAYPNGTKPVIEIRHGKSWTFIDCIIDGGSYPEIGEQKTAQADGSVKLETSQQVGTVTFIRTKFTRWLGDAPNRRVYDRKPGVQKIVFTDCIDPDGNKFSLTVE